MKEKFSDKAVEEHRKPDYPIHPLLLNRWSPRSMTKESLTEEELLPLFEAARWAPSSYNAQPWRFIYARRGTTHWDRFFHLLVDFNKQWCANAAVLGIIAARKTFEKTNKPSITHGLDTGAAWQNLCLEGTSRGLAVHGMEGFDYKGAQLFVLPECEVLAMFAVGKRAPKENLPPALQEKEVPSNRKKLEEFVFVGEMKKSSTP